MQTAAIFGDGMILQRDKPLRIWGDAAPGARIVVDLEGAPATTATADADGRWSTTLPPRDAARGLTLTVSGEDERIVHRDVSIGEVWIAGGQSNMEFVLDFDADRERVFTGPMNPDIRFFDVPKTSYEGQEKEHDYSLSGWWRSCTPEDLRYFSAAGYYFAEQLQAALGVPVGIVGCNWGGTPASAWTPRAALADGPGAVWLEDFDAGLRELDVEEEAAAYRAHRASDRSNPFRDPFLNRLMRDGISKEDEAEFLPAFRANFYPTVGSLHPCRPGGLFDTMVGRIAGYAARGVIWYQGESDIAHPELHGTVLETVIRTWRDAWDDRELPFLITQLAPFGSTAVGDGDLFPVIRHQQAVTAATVPLTWMASSSDAGAEFDIHPKNKEPIGVRLALLARRHVYGQDVAADAPELDRAERTATGVDLRLRHAAGLTAGDADLPLTVTGPDGEPVPVAGVDVDDEVLRIHGSIPIGSTISFAWTGYYTVDLRNGAGLPAHPFQVTV